VSDTQCWLYKIQPTRIEMLTEGLTESEERLVSEHFAYLKRLTDAGVVLLAGRTLNTDATTFGIVIFHAASEADARGVMENDPAVRAGVFGAELYPYSIALAGPIAPR
jgi:uncharacterized protein YciI